MRVQPSVRINTLRQQANHPLAFAGTDPETREERAARKAVSILAPILSETMDNPEHLFFSQKLLRLWASKKILRVPELTVNNSVIATYGYYPPLERVAQMELYRAEQEKKGEPFDSRHFGTQIFDPSPIEKLYVTNNQGNSARVTVRRKKITLDYEPLDKKLRTALPLNDAQVQVINDVLRHMRTGQLDLTKKIRDAGGQIPTVASFRDIVLPRLFRRLERGEILRAEKVRPNPFSDVSDEEVYEVVAKGRNQEPKGTYLLRRLQYKTDLTTHWMITDPKQHSVIRLRYAPDALFPCYIDKLSASGTRANAIVIDKAERIPKRHKTRRAAQVKLDERIRRRFLELEVRLRSEVTHRLAGNQS